MDCKVGWGGLRVGVHRGRGLETGKNAYWWGGRKKPSVFDGEEEMEKAVE